MSSRSTVSSWMGPRDGSTGWAAVTAPGRPRCSACCWAWLSPTAAAWKSWGRGSDVRWPCRTVSPGSWTARACTPPSPAGGTLPQLLLFAAVTPVRRGTARDPVRAGPPTSAMDGARGFPLGLPSGQRAGGDALVVRAAVAALDELVVRLVHAGLGVRELAPVISPLEAAFLALTEQLEDDR